MKYEDRPALVLAQVVWDKMWAMTEAVDIEVSGLGICSKDDPSYIEDLFILEQKCSPASTTMDEADILDFTEKLSNAGICPSRVSLWWHSHAKMNVFMSGTDEKQVEAFAPDGILYSIVTNHDKEIHVRADIRKPISMTWEDIDYSVDYLCSVPEDWVKSQIGKISKASRGGKSVSGNAYELREAACDAKGDDSSRTSVLCQEIKDGVKAKAIGQKMGAHLISNLFSGDISILVAEVFVQLVYCAEEYVGADLQGVLSKLKHASKCKSTERGAVIVSLVVRLGAINTSAGGVLHRAYVRGLLDWTSLYEEVVMILDHFFFPDDDMVAVGVLGVAGMMDLLLDASDTQEEFDAFVKEEFAEGTGEEK